MGGKKGATVVQA